MLPQPIATTPEIRAALDQQAPVAIGVSGGKDSAGVAFGVDEYLDFIGHTGPRILIHSDLGRVEWKDSGPTCARLADALGMELVTVRRSAGDMMDRWLMRWHNNVERYINLQCVKLILPWSTPAMRFCTSELKTAVICRDLVQRFPGQTILSASGIRREESPRRAKAPIAKQQLKLTSKSKGTTGYDWHPIIEWHCERDLLPYLALKNFTLHDAYRVWKSSRVSCAFCMMAKLADLQAAAACPDNAAIYREMVDLEIDSSFAFQDQQYLGDVAPQLLTLDRIAALAEAKRIAAAREAAESQIPKHLLYTSGWPTCMPTPSEAALLADVRQTVGHLLGLPVLYTTADSVSARYAELLAAKEGKTA